MAIYFSKRLAVMVAISLVAQVAIAKDIKLQQDDQRIQDLQTQKQLTTPVPTPPPPSPALSEGGQSVSLSADELSLYPELVVRAMAMAVLQNNAENATFLLPYYQAVPTSMQEPIVLYWAMGLASEHQGDIKKAINNYRTALSYDNDAGVLRLRLAMTLFANKEFEASKDQFTKLLSEKDIPPQIARMIEQYLQAIRQKNQWTVNGGVNFLNDKNINNAPEDSDLGGGWTAPKAQSAQGLGVNVDIGKKWTVQDGFFYEARLDTNAKYYWNNKPYNELATRLSVGVGHEDARHHFMLSPFIEKNYYAGGGKDGKLAYFSASKGLSGQWSYWLNPNWQASVHGEVSQATYTQRKHLDGMTRSGGVHLLYLPNAKQHYFVGVDASRSDTKDADDSFVRRGVRVGMGQELGMGFGVRTSLGYAKKDYRGAGFFGKIQHNDEYTASVSVWNKRVHYAGITPRLTWQYQRVDSNLPLYEYDKNKLFIEMSRQF